MIKKTLFTLVLMAMLPGISMGVEYSCQIKKKWNIEHIYTKEQLEKWKFFVKIQETSEGTYLSRCSFSPIENDITCDAYRVDRIEFDENVFIKKYYVFRSHFDVQVFQNLSMIENNGRGDFATGSCSIVSP